MPLPDWIKIKAYDKKRYQKTLNIIEKYKLVTVCKEANCPNRYECFSNRTATFMVLGDICTRNCLYCNIKKGTPKLVDNNEPKRIAKAVKKMGINYAVITCVTRDDLKDGGAKQFAKTVKEIRKINPICKIELLISDLQGNWTALKTILNSKPDVINHNLEAVRDIFSLVRPKGNYNLSLELLKKVKELAPEIKIKSGFMVGLGETKKQIIKTMKDLKRNNCEIITIGQYLQPSPDHFNVKKYYTPDEFEEIKMLGKKMSVKHIIVGPLIRSSYKAESCL